jgi:acyl-coenzyme A thioesterase PaaI-like protein
MADLDREPEGVADVNEARDVNHVTDVDHVIDVPSDDPTVAALIDLGNSLPFNRHLGVEVVEIGTGRCITRLRADDRLANHVGGVHAIAELAPMELAGALAATTRLRELLDRGFVPVVGSLATSYLAPATGELTATATVGEEAIAPALAAAEEGHKPRVVASVELTDTGGVVVAEAELTFVYLDVAALAPSADT